MTERAIAKSEAARSTSRRRFIAISAAAAGLDLLPFSGSVRAEGHAVTWRGVMLGAVATMRIHHKERGVAERLIARALDEARRLEQIFSLYRTDSTLVDLNRRGALAGPPPELVALLAECRRYAEFSSGAFDPTVQPLWELYANHFSRFPRSEEGPPKVHLAEALGRVGFRHVRFNRDRIVFARRGMALTFNGIAQGYVTDRVVDLLRSSGVDNSLVDMGETRVLGSKPDGRPWRVGVADPDDPEHFGAVLDVVNQAVATSGGYGCRFDAEGRFNHLFDPATGLCANRYRSVTVVASTAAAADALSTAFSLMPLAQIRARSARLPDVRVHVLTADRSRVVLGG